MSYQHTVGGKLKTVLHQSGIRTDYGYDTVGNLTHLTLQGQLEVKDRQIEKLTEALVAT